MRLTIRVFAGLAEKMGGSAVTLHTDKEQLTAGELKQLLAEQYPAAAGTISVSFVARNQAYAREDQLLEEEDELALIPPVSGGSPAHGELSASSKDVGLADSLYELTYDSLNPDMIAAKVSDANHGANLVFVGTTREFTGDEHTLSLHYDAYAPMALSSLRQIGNEVDAHWPGARCAITHRLGAVGIGEASVVIAVSAVHRDACYEASRFAIERLKQIVPIWKQDLQAGGATWKETQGQWDPTATAAKITLPEENRSC